MDSDFSCLCSSSRRAPFRMSSNPCLIRHGSSSTNPHRCRAHCAGRSLMLAAPRRATISTVTVIMAVQPTQTVRATVAAVLLPRSRRVRRRRTAVRDCLHCQPPRARRLAAAGPPDYQPSLARPLPSLTRRIARQGLPPVGRRPPARVERRSPLMLPPPLAR